MKILLDTNIIISRDKKGFLQSEVMMQEPKEFLSSIK